jgi:hypothetical protein
MIADDEKLASKWDVDKVYEDCRQLFDGMYDLLYDAGIYGKPCEAFFYSVVFGPENKINLGIQVNDLDGNIYKQERGVSSTVYRNGGEIAIAESLQPLLKDFIKGKRNIDKEMLTIIKKVVSEYEW